MSLYGRVEYPNFTGSSFMIKVKHNNIKHCGTAEMPQNTNYFCKLLKDLRKYTCLVQIPAKIIIIFTCICRFSTIDVKIIAIRFDTLSEKIMLNYILIP